MTRKTEPVERSARCVSRDQHDHSVQLASKSDGTDVENTHALSLAELAYRWSLWCVEGIGSLRLGQLVSLTKGELESLWYDRQCVLRCIKKLSLSARIQSSLDAMLEQDAGEAFSQLLDQLEKGERLIHRYDAAYPRRLLDLHDPPEFILVKGAVHELGGAQPLALVGSRKVPVVHEQHARRLGAQLARAGVLIVSGGALGMDACAHQGALDAASPTVAILPGGLRCLTPRAHLSLFEAIVEGGGVLMSEYPLDVAPRRYHYARRNRLIAALSKAVLVLRASPESGTMLTVKAAQELGRPILALPYEANDRGGFGSNLLIQKGEARMVCSCEDVLSSGLGLIEEAPVSEPLLVSVASARPREDDGLAWPAKQERCGVDLLARCWQVDVSVAQVRLFELELSGRVRKVPGAALYERSW